MRYVVGKGRSRNSHQHLVSIDLNTLLNRKHLEIFGLLAKYIDRNKMIENIVQKIRLYNYDI